MIDQINALLPQTQCGKCGYQGCRPYAEALAAGAADINRCPPGGEEGILALANFLGVAPKPLDSGCGAHKPAAVALIIEEDCIGCVKCLGACPVDAIVGAAKHMHTVIASECTGCELCIAPCPVDCIVMQETPAESLSLAGRLKPLRAELAKSRYEMRSLRRAREEAEKAARAREKKAALIVKMQSAAKL
ncbi:RnfABCDGE type electron transport complex subunit B [Methylomicrobium sp. Wu6]|uniref:RnfABCDGE type electron transport complex subunit B n=1 Tax=Methylomicrobium sp. Wu6 TaxID=3107928 RepID=UPI002DD695AC|nr:RnfABCDGE type electron transport complex subunit B [Methylomicrobium sp. Wu6]MEC4749981.1 RnfABCDGE type electron transport complex subunit B [Methylomicrobium sp. Wu6]